MKQSTKGPAMFQVSSRVLMSKLGSLPHSPSIGDTNSRSSSYKAGTISKFLWAVVPLDELRLATQFTLHVTLTVAIFPVSYLTMCEFARLHALATAELMSDYLSSTYLHPCSHDHCIFLFTCACRSHRS